MVQKHEPANKEVLLPEKKKAVLEFHMASWLNCIYLHLEWGAPSQFTR